MSKFTPGPWHWDCDLIKCESLDRVRYRVTALGKTIAQTYYSSFDENAEADTRLMACAPEMYDALSNLCADFEMVAQFYPDKTEASRMLGLVRAARAVLAKVDGCAAS